MENEQLIEVLKVKQMDDVLEIIEDAQKGYLEELELVESIGLVYDKELNEAVLNLLRELGVDIIYVKDEEE